MKIALVSDWFVPRVGGIEMQMRDLALALMARGHDVRVICGVPGEPEVDGIPVERLPGPRLPGFGIAVTPGVFRALRQAMAGGGYDVIHIQVGNVAPIAHHAMQYCTRHRLPAVASFHSVLKYYDVPLWFLDAMHGYSTSTVRFTTVSTVAAEAMRPLVKARDIGILPNGIDLDWWKRPEVFAPTSPPGRGEEGGPPVEFISVTRLQKRKRARWLVKAFAEAVSGLPPGSARLTIVGDGDERGALERIIRGAGLEQSVILAGRQPREAIRALLHRSDVFVLASKLESFGIAALEARAAGLPVLTMAQSGARDFLNHGVDALLAEDDTALAADIRAMIIDPAKRLALTAAAAAPPPGVDWVELAPRYEAEYRAAMAAIS
ncbi:MAG: glycosyltransferase family 4 protein [Phreatobacter sp.]|uniref:glycosyltransferase family 4 protein n=1 Tax=Phreatobacter sp. TaxID=1966341 RepID=UPI001A55CC34|nr:glycosyltransferase family 4 protein [Phreatobacter sp.]MBL8569037.1 glycosyltransferase family 4 protein [Phreatobacter sp.]